MVLKESDMRPDQNPARSVVILDGCNVQDQLEADRKDHIAMVSIFGSDV